jgi:hypothetical protein
MLGLLHTSPVHLRPFEALVRAQDPEVPLRQIVREDLLAEVRRLESLDEAVCAAVHAAVQDLAKLGARVVLCTCSTLGGAAESAPVHGCTVIRVDRPAIVRAVASGRRVLVVAALETALQQTVALLEQVASAQARALDYVSLLCPGAWELFERGDTEHYLGAVAETIDASATDQDLVLLAQASMAAASEYVRRQDVHVLSTPRLAVQAALAARSRDRR